MVDNYEKFISKTFLSLGCLFFLIIVVMTFIQVITRYIVNISFPWAEEFLRFSYTCMILFGILTTAQIQVPLLRIMIFERFKYGWLLSSVLYIVMLICLFLLVKGGIKLYEMNINSYYSAFKISISWIYVPFILCLILEMVRVVIAFISLAKTRKVREL
ncbi:TRAP transporter small permease [Rodentibacter trehalosifermentans]|uniref:TRAP transporter small permease protein n=1 Tax=Rodentibacter trehalosifermentans TaxID=1908263 RepID=A0A1V3J1I7_9PAST|nr:TRAP transporter small permease [Rodentibacter trehalosifermentans]OOF43604.1 C4-dicarboxylate ABC transporter substrate-binding protein [Rodentibacter trehalosifermentans]OOF48850.1 C4-dicarboxylate ABC transporter substrate-binding protein [Rodentibacter trehalosifermentans]OOF51383.1 C4-dicarboxylate ABC transporter substrate-binding protein [Rodentibacter trehalosifermentans]